MATIRNIVLAGDSTVQGTVGAANFAHYNSNSTGSWVERLSLLAGYNYGPLLGAGLRGLWLKSGFSSWIEWASTGTWTSTTSSDVFDVAPFGLGLYNSTGGTLQWIKPAQMSAAAGFAVYWIDASGQGNWQYSIDGGSFINMGQTILGDNKLKKFYVPTAVTDSVTIKAYDGSHNCLATIAGIEPYRLDPRTNSGVIVHNLGRDSNFLASFAAVTSGDRLAFLDSVVLGTNAVSNTPNDFAVMFTNDVALTSDPTAFQSSMTSLMSRLASAGCGNRTVMLPFEQLGRDVTVQANYRAAGAAAAAATDSKYLDIYSLWANAYGGAGWSFANAAGLMYDSLHESDLGHKDIASRLWWGS